jgi:spore germination protein YaaH
VVAWVIGGAQSLQSLQDNLDAVSVASPAYYKVGFDAAGGTRLGDWDPQNPVQRPRLREVTRGKSKLVPLIACLDRCAARLSPVLADAEQSKRHVEAIVAGVAADELDGVFIDYEGLRCPAPAFTRFAGQLRSALRARGLSLGIAITEPCGVSEQCQRPGYPFEIGRLAALADHLAVMAYDYRVDGSDAVAPRDWVARGLERVASEAKDHLERIYVGVPFYGRITAGLTKHTAVLWSDLGAGAIQGQALQVQQRRFEPAKLSQVARVTVGAGARPGTIHYEDHTTLWHRLRLIAAAGLHNIAIWRLGGEDPCSWEVIRAWRRGSWTPPSGCPVEGS